MPLKTIFSILFTCCYFSAFTQHKIYIAPHTVISLDTAIYKVDDVFGHDMQQTILFKSTEDSSFSFSISAYSGQLIRKKIDTRKILEQVSRSFSKNLIDSDILYASELYVREYKGTSFILKNKLLPFHMTSVLNITKFDSSGTIDIYSTMSFPSEDLKIKANQHVNYISDIIDLIRLYSRDELDSFRKTISTNCSFNLLPLPIMNLYTWNTESNGKIMQHKSYNRDSVPKEALNFIDKWKSQSFHTYRGQLIIKSVLEYSVLEVKVYSSDYPMCQSFFPDSNGNIIITSNDKTKGRIEKKCYVIFRLQNGLLIRLPWAFEYENN